MAGTIEFFYSGEYFYNHINVEDALEFREAYGSDIVYTSERNILYDQLCERMRKGKSLILPLTNVAIRVDVCDALELEASLPTFKIKFQ